MSNHSGAKSYCKEPSFLLEVRRRPSVQKRNKPGTGNPLHTQEPVTVASFRTWRGWRECVARDRCLTQSSLAFALLTQPNQAISADNLKRVADILTVGVYCRQIIGVVEQDEGRTCGRYK